MNNVYLGDCKDALKKVPDDSVDLIFTSPPYADSRVKIYGGIHPDLYVAWFLERSNQFLRVLKPTGSFVLNIKEKVVDGERHTYVIDLIKALRGQGWLWTEEYIWHKRTSTPGKWPNRFRDAWERCLHFNKTKKFKMNQGSVKIPIGDWAKERLKKLSENDKIRYNSATKSGFGKNISNWVDKETVYPTNVLHLAPECGNKKHSASFPDSLPRWFITLFTDKDDVVLDPFVGSGTTVRVAKDMERQYIGIDQMEEYVNMTRESLKGE
jgi:DNA modification methylase